MLRESAFVLIMGSQIMQATSMWKAMDSKRDLQVYKEIIGSAQGKGARRSLPFARTSQLDDVCIAFGDSFAHS